MCCKTQNVLCLNHLCVGMVEIERIIEKFYWQSTLFKTQWKTQTTQSKILNSHLEISMQYNFYLCNKGFIKELWAEKVLEWEWRYLR